MIQNWASLVEGVTVSERRAFALKTPELEKTLFVRSAKMKGGGVTVKSVESVWKSFLPLKCITLGTSLDLNVRIYKSVKWRK